MAMRPRLLIDEQLPLIDRFAEYAHVEAFEASALSETALRNADALIVRSVTRVDKALLNGTSVRFVGTATSGTDHIDVDYLDQADIKFADAKGANAPSVAQYVLACINHYCTQTQRSPRELTLGIVGLGNIGGLVGQLAQTVGMAVIASDPPLEAKDLPGSWVPLSELVSRSDIITVHVPLTDCGHHATRRLLDLELLRQIRPKAALIHTSRGGVVDEAGLEQLAEGGRLHFFSYIDVWENEPEVNEGLVRIADIATPHIAGYSIQSRQRAVKRLLAIFYEHFFGSNKAAESQNPSFTEPQNWWELDECRQVGWLPVAAALFPIDPLSSRFKASIPHYGVRKAFVNLRAATSCRDEIISTPRE